MPVSSDRFVYLSTFLKRETGIAINESKLYLIRTRLQPIARDHGFESINALVDAIKQNEHGTLAAIVLDQMTTNETLFFRDAYPFEVLRKHLFPALLKSKSPAAKLKIWSAAASTGQEGYSIAITALNEINQAASRIKIIGTDISPRAIHYGQQGLYKPMDVQRGLPVQDLKKYFIECDGGWQAGPQLKSLVHFQEANLIAPTLITSLRHYGLFDIVFCRNVLIYFEVEQRKQVIDQIAQLTEIGGYLFTGAGEMVEGNKSRWEIQRFENRPVWRLVSRN